MYRDTKQTGPGNQPTPRNHATLRGRVAAKHPPHGASRDALAAAHAQLRQHYLAAVRNSRFEIYNVSFKFDWTLATFARENKRSASDPATSVLMEKMRRAAQRDLAAWCHCIQSAPICAEPSHLRLDIEPPDTHCHLIFPGPD